MAALLTAAQVVALLAARKGGRSRRAFAKEIGCTAAFLSMVLRGERGPGDEMLDYLKLERVPMYQRKGD